MTQAVMSLDALSPGRDLDHYIQTVAAFPLLSAEEERELGERLRDHNDVEAARRLVLSHLRFVVHIARSYAGYGLPLGDLVQEGNVGLMKAVRRFDPDYGVRLVSFAVHWIRAEMHEFILRNWRIVRVATTKAQRKLFFNLRGAKKRLGWMNRDEVEAIAGELGVPAREVLQMEGRLAAHDAAFDGDARDEDDVATAPVQYLEDADADPAERVSAQQWSEHTGRALVAALESLDERSRTIVERRWLADEKATLQELADEYAVSAERIRQLEAAAMRKLRKHMD